MGFFDCLGLEEDADLKNRLLRQIIVGRPVAWVLPAPNSPDLYQDDSVRGVHVRAGKGVPNSAELELPKRSAAERGEEFAMQ
eukprot:scaffold3821_cov173-Amphora_coffeaeformis.AAC.15